jgi:hypothetical protein
MSSDSAELVALRAWSVTATTPGGGSVHANRIVTDCPAP